jgi:hypothetical protein
MVSPQEMEMVADTRIEEWQRAIQRAEYRAWVRRELAGLDTGRARSAWQTVSTWLRGRFAMAGIHTDGRGSTVSEPRA